MASYNFLKYLTVFVCTAAGVVFTVIAFTAPFPQNVNAYVMYHLGLALACFTTSFLVYKGD